MRKIEKICTQYLKKWEKFNSIDPYAYKSKKLYNQYVGALNKRGWLIPFVLNDFDNAKNNFESRLFMRFEELKYCPDDESEQDLLLEEEKNCIDLILGNEAEIAKLIEAINDRINDPDWRIYNLVATDLFLMLNMIDKDKLIRSSINSSEYIAHKYRLESNEKDFMKTLVVSEANMWSHSHESLDQIRGCTGLLKELDSSFFWDGERSRMRFDRKYYSLYLKLCEELALKNINKSLELIDKIICHLGSTRCFEYLEIMAFKLYEILLNIKIGNDDIVLPFKKTFPYFYGQLLKTL